MKAAQMRMLLLIFLTIVTIQSGLAQGLDISGYKVVQANATQTFVVPAGTTIPAGGYVIIARNASRTSFETFWGLTLPASTVFFNTADVGGVAPKINGAENFTLRNAVDAVLDGPTVSLPGAGGENVRRLDANASASLETSWSRTSSSTTSNATPGSGMTNTNSGKLVISEF